MSKKSQKAAVEALAQMQEVSDEYLQFWIDNEIGGSGLNISMQHKLKTMSKELLEYRNLFRERSFEEQIREAWDNGYNTGFCQG